MMDARKEEGECPLGPLLHLSNVAAPRPRRPTPDHPPYAEMVRVALRELAEEGGSTEASISRYIQSNYTRLPPGHSRLLPYYLGKFVAAGDVSMLSPNRFALPSTPPSSTLPQPPHHYPIPPPNPNPNPRRSSFRQKPAGPQIPRRRGRPPKRRKATVGGLMLLPWPKSPHHVTDSSASPAPAPRRGRGRPRKNPETKVPTPAEPVPRPRLIIRLRSKPPNPMPDTVSEVMSKCNLRDVDGLEAALPANAHIDQELSLLPTDAALLPLVSVRSEPDVEMLHMDQMQPEPEGGLLLLRPESEFLLRPENNEEQSLLDQMQPEPEGGLLLLRPESEFLLRAPQRPENNEEQSLPTSVKPKTERDQSVLGKSRPKSIEESSPPAVRSNAESLLPASVHLEPEPSEEPLASTQLHIEAKEQKEQSLSSSTIEPKSDELFLPQVSVHPEPWKEELLQLLPQQSETGVDLLPLPGPMQSELHEEPILSISTQPDPEEQLALSAPLRMELVEISSQPAGEQPESIEETLLQPELIEISSQPAGEQLESIEETLLQLDEEYLPPAQLLPEPKEEPLPLPSIQIEPKEELLSLASVEPVVKEESSPPAPIPAMEKGEKSGHSSKHRRTHAKHRKLWFEC